LVYERKSQTPNIITETIKQGLVVDPNTKLIRVENGTFNLEDNSRLSSDKKSIRFVTESKLVDVKPSQITDTEKYSQESALTIDTSNLNVDTVVKTIPFGRNENPSKSGLSIVGTQQVNFFLDTNANGFIVKTQKGQTSYKDGSVFGWSGNSKSAPSTNFITDVNGKGFQTFTQPLETTYQTESSRFGFTNIPQTDFFDVTKQYTLEGFKKFVTSLQTAYQPDASQFVWTGNSGQSPETNYFDINNSNTNTGFVLKTTISDLSNRLTDSNFCIKLNLLTISSKETPFIFLVSYVRFTAEYGETELIVKSSCITFRMSSNFVEPNFVSNFAGFTFFTEVEYCDSFSLIG